MEKKNTEVIQEKVYKHISVRHLKVQGSAEEHEGRPLYRVINNKKDFQLAFINYYKPWNKWVMHTREGIVFDKSCLKDIVDFIENEIKYTPPKKEDAKIKNLQNDR